MTAPTIAATPKAGRGASGPTPRALLVYAYLRDFNQRNDQLPPAWKISEHFGWVSQNAAAEHLVALERHGLIEKNEVAKWRFVRSNAA